MTDPLMAFIEERLTEDELWAKAASAGRDPEDGTVAGGVHWTWAAGDQWEAVEPDPLEPYMGGYEGQWSQPVVLRTVEEWQLSWGGPGNTMPNKIAESEELRTADGAHIARHDPARVLREVKAKRRLLKWAQDRLHDAEDFPADEGYRLEAMGVLRLHLPLLALPYADHPDYRAEWGVDHG